MVQMLRALSCKRSFAMSINADTNAPLMVSRSASYGELDLAHGVKVSSWCQGQLMVSRSASYGELDLAHGVKVSSWCQGQLPMVN